MNHEHEPKLFKSAWEQQGLFDKTSSILCGKYSHGTALANPNLNTAGVDLNKHTCQNFIRYRAGLQFL